MEVSEELHHKIECAFIDAPFPTKDRYKQIAPNWLGVCPMLSDEGLCSLQLEVGEAKIPNICRVYPRCYYQNNGKDNYLILSSSCEKVVELLIDNEFALVKYNLNTEPNIKYELKDGYDYYHNEGIKIIFSNKSLQEKLISLAKVFKVEEKEVDLSSALSVISKAIEIFSPLSSELQDYNESFSKLLISNSHIDLYQENLKKLKNKFKDFEKILDKILKNHYYYSNFPQVDERVEYMNSINGLIFSYALMKYILVMNIDNINNMDEFVDNVSKTYHFIEHTAFYYNSFVIIKDPYSLIFV